MSEDTFVQWQACAGAVSYTHLDVYKRQVKGFVQQAIEVCELPAGPYMYGEMLDSDLVQICLLYTSRCV